MDSRMVIGIVFGSLVVVIFSVVVVVFMILRFHNLQKTIKPKDWNICHASLIYDKFVKTLKIIYLSHTIRLESFDLIKQYAMCHWSIVWCT